MRVLFVGDEPNVLAGFRRTLRCMSSDWDMEFVTSGADELEDFAAHARIGADLLSTIPSLDAIAEVKNLLLRNYEIIE